MTTAYIFIFKLLVTLPYQLSCQDTKDTKLNLAGRVMSNLHRGFNSLGILLLVVGVVAMWILAEQRNINTEVTMLELAEEVVVLEKQIKGLEAALAAVPRTEAVRGINANFVEGTTGG